MLSDQRSNSLELGVIGEQFRQMELYGGYFLLDLSNTEGSTHPSVIPLRSWLPSDPTNAATSSLLCKEKMRNYFRYTTDARTLVLSGP
ncbi:unnamed protein product [Boreogadus saida]